MDTEQERKYASDEEEEESEQEVHDTDFFVVGCGQPWLEVAPETSNGECVRAASVENPHSTKENNGDGQSDSGQEDDQWRGAWTLGFSVQSRNDNGLNVPVIVGRTIASAGCTTADGTTADGVTDDRHLNGCSIADWRLEFKVP
ncbi:MAG: Uncharacterised protein [Candidatus Poseidoniaceae archaeon]|nr:MAG: Uncharacterised protein [Candidatus Poseidoniaceae archaeon]